MLRPSLTHASALALLLALATVPTAPAALSPAPFSLQYDIDEPNDRIGFSVNGVYSVAIDCASEWSSYSALTLPPLTLRPPEYMRAMSNGAPAPKSVVYHVTPGEGSVRVSEFVHGTRTTDTIFSCARFTLDAGPSQVSQPTEEVTHEAPDGATCEEELRADAWLNAQLDDEPKESGSTLRASDTGVCIVLGYATMVPLQTCRTAQGVCVPFSGNLGGYVKTGELAPPHRVWAEGMGCSDFIIGGFCFGGEPDGAEDDFEPCECRVNSRAFTAFNDLTGFTSAGSWYFRVERSVA